MNAGPSELKRKAVLGGKMHPQILAEMEAKHDLSKIFVVSHVELGRFLHAL